MALKGSDPPSSFQRFNLLAKRLLAVPKEAADRQKAQPPKKKAVARHGKSAA